MREGIYSRYAEILAPARACQKPRSLCVAPVVLCASVVSLPQELFTTETQRATEFHGEFKLPSLRDAQKETMITRAWIDSMS